MKFALAKEHRDYFQKNGFIAFEDLLSADQTSLVHHEIQNGLAERLELPKEKLKKLSSENLFLEGRDLWRINGPLRKAACQMKLAEIASELVEKKPLRLGYTQYFPSFYEDPYSETKGIYRHFLQKECNLQSMSSVENVACGLMLSFGPVDAKQGDEVFFYGPRRAVYFAPDKDIHWHKLLDEPGYDHYLIVYTQGYSHYLLEPNDPHTHFLKHLGYIFNDKLNDRLHPIVYR